MSNAYFYKNHNGMVVGPVSPLELKKLAQLGSIQGETMIKMGGGNWVKAGSIRVLFNFPSQITPVSLGEGPTPSQTIQPRPSTLQDYTTPPPVPRTIVGNSRPQREYDSVEMDEKKGRIGPPQKRVPIQELTNRGFWTRDLGKSPKWICICVALIILGYKPFVFVYNLNVLNTNKAIIEYNKGVEMSKYNQFDKAIDHYTKSIEIDPKMADAYANRGAAYLRLKQFENALKDCNSAIAMDPKMAYAYGNRGAAYLGLEQFENALKDCNSALALDPKMANAYYNRGVAYLMLKHFDNALKDCNSAIALDPKMAYAYGVRGAANLGLKQFDKSIADYSKAIDIDPNDPDFYDVRGNAYKEIGKDREAQADFSTAKKLRGE